MCWVTGGAVAEWLAHLAVLGVHALITATVVCLRSLMVIVPARPPTASHGFLMTVVLAPTGRSYECDPDE